MYARGMSTREIRAHIAELYALTVSAEFLSKVTDAVSDEVAEWQSRPESSMLNTATSINMTTVETRRKKQSIQGRSLFGTRPLCGHRFRERGNPDVSVPRIRVRKAGRGE